MFRNPASPNTGVDPFINLEDRGRRILRNIGTISSDNFGITSQSTAIITLAVMISSLFFNPLKPELNPICSLLTLLGAHHFLHVSRIRLKLLTFRLLMS